jgi:hypothetical protein
MTTEIGRFVIDDGQQDLVTIADVATAASFTGAIMHALREGLNVRYRQPGEVIQIAAPEVTKSTAPRPTVNKQPAKVVHKRAGKRRMKKAGKTPAAVSTPKPATPATAPALGTEEKKSWTVGDVVFIAWRSLTSAERETFDNIRESMGVVHAIQRGRGIRRTVGVKWDTRDTLEWHHPNDLSAVCEYCHDERGLGEDEITEEAGELMAAGA